MLKINLKYLFEFYVTLSVPLIYLAGLYFISLSSSLSVPPTMRIGALTGVLFGLILWILSYLHLSNSFGVLPKSQVRVKRGVYRLFRHPMYVGITLTYLGLSIANQSRAGLLFTMFILTPLLVVRALLEEKLLTNN